ncbi:DUF3221 domain-containing protein, partial [Listeria monocytogenes]|nr:DUF3221 domain-containing protein [Listeria monocytogenes]EDF4276654.1 DUF3221 domain-containing protein [Listeria monocytogenes]
MKKIISLILLLLILTACSNDPQKESSVEANGIVESVDGYSIVVNRFKENSKKVTADKGEKIY